MRTIIARRHSPGYVAKAVYRVRIRKLSCAADLTYGYGISDDAEVRVSERFSAGHDLLIIEWGACTLSAGVDLGGHGLVQPERTRVIDSFDRLLTLCQNAVADYEKVHVRAHEAAEGILWAHNNRFTANVE